MATIIRPYQEDPYLGPGTGSMGSDLPAKKEGLITQNSRYDRRSAENQKRNGGSSRALHKVFDPTDLDLVPDEVAFMVDARARSPYDTAKNMMTVMTSVCGMEVKDVPGSITAEQMAKLIEDQITPVGISMDRLPFKDEGGFQLPRTPIAVQTSGKATLRSELDIPVGSMVRVRVPTPADVRGRTISNRVGGRPASKVVLELAPVNTGMSFAQRTLNTIILRNKGEDSDGDNNGGHFANTTSEERAFTKIENSAIMDYVILNLKRNTIDQHGNPDTAGMADPAIETRMQNEVLPLLNPTAQNLHERKRLIRSLFAPTENAVFFTSLATDELKNRVADNKNQCFSAYADLMRLESNFVIGKCTRFNNHMADILL